MVLRCRKIGNRGGEENIGRSCVCRIRGLQRLLVVAFGRTLSVFGGGRWCPFAGLEVSSLKRPTAKRRFAGGGSPKCALGSGASAALPRRAFPLRSRASCADLGMPSCNAEGARIHTSRYTTLYQYLHRPVKYSISVPTIDIPVTLSSSSEIGCSIEPITASHHS